MYKRRLSPWTSYLIAIAFGLLFSVTLVSFAWHNALYNNKGEFALASTAVENITFNNVRAVHDALNNLVTFFIADTDMNEQEFSMFSRDILGLLPQIDGIAFYPFTPTIEYDENNRWQFSTFQEDCPVFYQTMRSGLNFQANRDLTIDEHYQEIMRALVGTNSIIAVPVPAVDQQSQDYWLFKLLRNDDLSKADKAQSLPGLAGVFVKTEKLLDATYDTDASLTMISNAPGLSGQQLLYNMPAPDRERGWVVNSLLERGVLQFAKYSIKLDLSKDVGWAEIEKNLVYTALLIGIGMTLLLVALVRAKDLQTKQLRERNIFVERQVKAQTKELALARDAAIEASRVKSEFLAGMSHEIRTPLNAIIGMSELLAKTYLSAEQKNYIRVFQKAGDNLLSLVNDILDLAKIEAGQLILEDIHFDLLDTVEECTEVYAAKAAEKGIGLLSHVHNDLANRRTGDSKRLRQILLNLISNAMKFTEQGEIVVSVQRFNEAEADNDDTVLFSVSDTGIGIAREKLEIIFTSFTQADSSTTRRYGGTGLGLTISRSLVGMMGGSIWVESEQGTGSVFKFTAKLPVAQSEAGADVHAQMDLQRKKLCLIDDNAIRSEIIVAYLQAANAQVEHVSAGSDALATLEKAAGSFALVLLDSDISGLNGLELAKQIKQRYQALPIIVILQADELAQHMDKLEKTGANSYVIKPIKKQKLLQKVSALLSITEQGMQAGTEPLDDETVARPLSILLVDDNADNILLIKAYLENLPYTLDEAENGQIALDKFKQTAYDLVLMDVQMPVMDGHQAMRAIRSWEKETASEPSCVIALTAHAFKEEIDKCFASGCDAHLSKPIKKAQLMSAISSMTTDKRDV